MAEQKRDFASKYGVDSYGDSPESPPFETQDGESFATRLAHFGDDEARLHGAVAPAIFPNSTYLFERTADLHAALTETPWGPPHHYSRLGNPTNDLVQRKIADLEGMDECRLVSSGMAAVTLGILTLLDAESHAVVVDGVYGPAGELFSDY
ncbi:MAG: hypothetical protein C4320_05095, partial [Armatimonadota bacterium]